MFTWSIQENLLYEIHSFTEREVGGQGADRQEIEVVDLFLQPKRALAEGVFMTPTLERLIPASMKRIVGTLSQTEILLQALVLEAIAP